jgi:hypothetical protein
VTTGAVVDTRPLETGTPAAPSAFEPVEDTPVRAEPLPESLPEPLPEPGW